MRELERVRLGAVCDEVDYGHTASARFTGTGPKFLRITDIQQGTVDWRSVPVCDCDPGEEPKYSLRDGDIVFARTGATTGKSFLITDCPSGAVFASYLIRIRPGERVLAPYLAHFFQTTDYWEQITVNSSGSAQPGVNATKLRALQLPLFALPEQERIVAALDEAFEAIASATTNTQRNLANARELFDSQLIRLLSPQGEQWVDATIQELVDDGVLAKPQDGNHGEIHPKKADFVPSGIPFIMAADLVKGSVDQENCSFLPRHQADSLRKGFSRSGDILLSHKGTIGRVAELRTELDYVMLTPQVTYYRPEKRDKLDARFLYYALQSPAFQEQMLRIAKAGSTRAYIGITRQLQLRLAYPPIAEQKRIAQKLDEAESTCWRLQSLASSKQPLLSALKQSILQRAFNGELTAVDHELSDAGV